MTALEALGLVIAILLISGFIAYLVQTGTKSLAEMTKVYHVNEELQEVAELAKDLYTEEFKQEQVISQDISQEVIQKAIEIGKITPEESIPDPVKPKKKRKYHPRKPKTQI